MADLKDQRHPQYMGDRQIVTDLLGTTQPSDRNLADLARLCIRYRGFQGARDIQADLLKVLAQWHLTEEQLYAKTREIHTTAKVFATHNDGRDDWA
ncbi:DUF3288 family protein [Tumidithrix elongata RA019]|uniref:DUF3288 family protein n=1 Tax=Tumidithrix elongata BACA0141 TaxID=2716417 RepID=A0AAW9PP39_9CYAN|nr:DUF3288 family protein [Tumidithrix elongata RA019]